MRDWQSRLRKLVAHGPELPEPYCDAFEARPPSGLPWPEALPPCPPLQAFYATCDGGGMGPEYGSFDFAPLSELEEVSSDHADVLEEEGEDDEFKLTPGRWLVFGHSEFGHVMFWDAGQDRVVAWDHDGGGWSAKPADALDPIGRTIAEFLDRIFFPPEGKTGPERDDLVTTEGWIIEQPKGEISWFEALDRVQRPEGIGG